MLKDKMSELDEREKKVSEKEDFLIEKVDKVETLLQNMAKVLANNTNYATMVSSPKSQETKSNSYSYLYLKKNSCCAQWFPIRTM